ncbi:hypothetical protein B4N89_26830 [Embleya scabrispora]|uniref:NIF system FeS cluster assembly NifU C-terminal domain-containing protein n=1 Tax=Embleya scabrispora TaxID=159449 RepID=A0A1T3P4S8_9ACTN|nr:hypothetical protein [Embleya scabrispora]OPC84063.1 hypothetical protein B4N89_26830 [Embleya scabrispora]
MTNKDISDEAVSQALAPLAQTLAADDYQLNCARSAPHHVLVTVTAGPAACADCLVPKELIERMALQRLRALGPSAPWAVEVRYPTDPAETITR